MKSEDERELSQVLKSENLTESDNNRRNPRNKIFFEIVFLKKLGTYLIKNEHYPKLGNVIDISKGGICFSSAYDFNRDDNVIFISLAMKKNFAAEITIRHKFLYEAAFAYGCEFKNLIPIEKVRI